MSNTNLNKCMIVDTDNCSGCRICELICSMVKFGEYNPHKSHIKLIRNREMDVNIIATDSQCDFCGTCIQWCPHDALTIVDTKEAALIRRKNKIGKFPAPMVK